MRRTSGASMFMTDGKTNGDTRAFAAKSTGLGSLSLYLHGVVEVDSPVTKVGRSWQ